MGCYVGFKYAKNTLAAGAPPRTPLGELTTFPLTSYSGADGRGTGGATGHAPQTMDKILKLSCHIMHITCWQSLSLMTIKPGT